MKTVRISTVIALLALSLGGVAAPSVAQQVVDPTHISNHLGSLTPYTGTYLDLTPGVGVSFEYDQGPSNNGFITLHTYDATGHQINYEGQHHYQPTTEQERLATGIIGRASGEFSIASGGACLGCAPMQQILTDVGIGYTLTWTNARNATLTLSGAQTGSYTLVAANFEGRDDDEFLSGTWAATVFNDYASFFPGDPTQNYQTAYMAVLTIAPVPSTYTFALAAGAASGTFVPPSTARLYLLTCPADEKRQGGANRQACVNVLGELAGTGSDAVAWFDPVSKGAGIETVQTIGLTYWLGATVGALKPYAAHIDLEITPDALRGHQVSRYGTTSDAATGIAFIRLPDGTVRSSFDYPAPPAN